MNTHSATQAHRTAGILLHPTSLPGPFGIGEIGPRALRWVEQLAKARQTWWQILPLGPTGYGDSPYQCFSASAGNPNLISTELLLEDGLLVRDDLDHATIPEEWVDFDRVNRLKAQIVRIAWARFKQRHGSGLTREWESFHEEEAHWLNDFGIFMALKEVHGGGSWLTWPAPYRFHDPSALADAKRDLADAVGMHEFAQFLFFRQWRRLKEHANSLGVRLLGDVPIFVAGDSVDVWANPDLFLLDDERRPAVVAGVPPDYFSKTGQLWGNPLYDWQRHRDTGYRWWVDRLRATLRQVDLVRLDHFRGFEAYWEVPAGSSTAQGGRWVPGPGAELLETLRRELGGLPIIAEDLGVITPAVDSLRRQFHLPGMRILQFAFGGAVEERFLPHNFENPTIVYTGTHDNDTTHGWFAQLTAGERRFTLDYLARDGNDIAWDLIRVAWASIADVAIAPIQDLLHLGTDARMNTPGTAIGNWRWRFTAAMPLDDALDRLTKLTTLYQRG